MEEFRYSVAPQDNFLLVEANGKAQPNLIISMYEDVVKQAEKLQISSILLNAVELQLDYSSLNTMEVMARLKEILKGMYLARVVSFGDYKNSLIETISEQQQLTIKNFDDMDTAKSWLAKIR